MAEKIYELSDGKNSVDLVGAGIIGIAVAGQTERHKGEATIRFRLRDENALGEEPYGSVVAWQYEDAKFALVAPGLEPIEGCSVRECNLNIENRDLYIQIYVPRPAQQVRHWFVD